MSGVWECGSCRWFKLSPYPEDAPEGEDPTRWGRCSFVNDNAEHGDPKPRSIRAYPQDASGYSAWLVVRTDFGCIEHAER